MIKAPQDQQNRCDRNGQEPSRAGELMTSPPHDSRAHPDQELVDTAADGPVREMPQIMPLRKVEPGAEYNRNKHNQYSCTAAVHGSNKEGKDQIELKLRAKGPKDARPRIDIERRDALVSLNIKRKEQGTDEGPKVKHRRLKHERKQKDGRHERIDAQYSVELERQVANAAVKRDCSENEPAQHHEESDGGVPFDQERVQHAGARPYERSALKLW